jgi:hypothetical protein
LRSDEDFTECSKAAWNYLKNHNARKKPPTYYYYYGIKFYFLQTPLSTLLESEKTDTEFLVSLGPEYVYATRWLEIFLEKYYLPETQERNSTKYSGDSTG